MTTRRAGDRRSHGDAEHARHLFGLRDQFAVVTAILEQVLRVGLLEIAAAEFAAGYLGRDGEYGDSIAMTIVEAVDEVKISGPQLPAQTAIPP